MKKRICGLFVLLCSMILLYACSQVRKYTMECENGDKIEVAIDGKGGYTTSMGATLEISKDGDLVFECQALKGEQYDKMTFAANQDKTVTILGQSKKENNKYIFFQQNNSFNYIELIDGSSTAILFKGAKTKEAAESTFAQITCTKK